MNNDDFATFTTYETFRHNPLGKVFSKSELQAIGDLCVKHNIIILSDEVCAVSSMPNRILNILRFMIVFTTPLSPGSLRCLQR
jgi:hypothetical protein